MTQPLRLLVVDDVPEHARMVEDLIRTSESWATADVRIAVDYDAALRALADERFDVAFFDYWLGRRDGLSLLREIRRKGIETPVVVLTSRGAEEVAVEAMKAGAADYLGKAGLNVEALERAIRRLRCTPRKCSAGTPRRRSERARSASARSSITARTRSCSSTATRESPTSVHRRSVTWDGLPGR